jgi:hypothetical protein
MYNGNIPTLRQDLDLSLYNEDGEELILLVDRKKIADKPVIISKDFLTFLLFLDNNFTVDELKDYFKKEFQVENIDNLLGQLYELDELGYLNSEKFYERYVQEVHNYENLLYRPMITANLSYPSEPQDFLLFIDELLKKDTVNFNSKMLDGIIVPHLDLSLENYSHKIYASGYNTIKETNPDLVIVFGTSHFVSSDNFMLTKKNYSTPIGEIETDIDFLNDLTNELNGEITIDEMAHRYEHSIEYPAVILKYLFKGKSKILPILVGSFSNPLINNTSPMLDNKIKNFIEALKRTIAKSNKKIVYIASVDFSHIGKKFGNDFDAKEKLDECKVEDKKSINHLLNLDYEGFFKQNSEHKNKWNICGLNPIYSMLATMDAKQGYFLDYAQWYEEETKSAVTIASLGFSK